MIILRLVRTEDFKESGVHMVTMDRSTIVLDTNCINNDCNERIKMLTLSDSKTGGNKNKILL